MRPGNRIGTVPFPDRLLRKKGFWTLQAGIFPENKVSIELHQRHGFRVLGVREKVGKMDFSGLRGKWRDVVLMERRSKTVGID